MSSNKKIQQIQKDFDQLLTPSSDEERQEADAQLLTAKFLSCIQEITDQRNIKRKELAALIGTSPSYLTQVFRGNKPINLLTLVKIQRALRIEFEVSVKRIKEINLKC